MTRRLRARLRAWFVVEESDAIVAPAPPVPVREIVRRFWPYARPYRAWLWVSLLLIVLGPAIDTATIWLFKVVTDEVLVPRDLGPLPWIALAYLGLTLASGVVSFCHDVLTTWLGGRFVLGLRRSVFERLQGLSLGFFERRRLGDLVARTTGDVGAVEAFVVSGVAQALGYLLRIVFFTGALFYLQWDLALVALVVAPLFWLAARRFSRLIRRAARERRRRSGSISAVAEESLGNAQLVQAYNRQTDEVARLHRESVGNFAADLASTRIKALFTPVVELIELAGAIIVIGMGTWALSEGRLSLGGLLVFIAYLSQLYSPIRGLGRLTNTLYAASAGAERIIEVLDERPAVEEPAAALALGRADGAVALERVTMRYPGAARPAVEDVSLAVAPGEMLALVGASGAGKSTIAKLLLRFYDPDSGRVSLDGHDVRDLTLTSLRENIAVVLQETLVFDGSVRENIAYGRAGATDDAVRAAAAAADAHEFIAALPEGYDTVIGQRGRRLSGGQRQRIAIARAMVRDAPVLILDEPTTGLDVESGERILEPLRRLMRGRATIVISHNLMTVRDATEIVVLEDGRVGERGTHHELLGARGAYARLYVLHAGAGRRDEPAGVAP